MLEESVRARDAGRARAVAGRAVTALTKPQLNPT